MNSSALRTTIFFSGGLAALHILGALFPTIFTWGFHFLGFLPRSFLIIYLLLIITGIAYIAKGYCEPLVSNLSLFMDRKPLAFLAIAVGAFIAFAVILRVKVPLLGDSFLVVKIYSKAASGMDALPASHQPLTQHYFYLFTKLLESFDYPALLNAFLVAELLLGIGFITVTYYVVRNLFDSAAYRCISFLLLLVLPYIELFFGYVEMYAVILLVLAAYVLVGILYLREKIHFALVPLSFAVLLLSHYLNALILPSLLYLGFVEYKRHRLKHLAASVGALLGFVAIGITVVNFNFEKFIPPYNGAPILTITPSDNIFQAYTLLSPYHFVDLLNLAILLWPSALFLIGMAFARRRASLFNSDFTRFLAAVAAPSVAFVLAARFDIPMAQDWDVSASSAYTLTLLALVVASTSLQGSHSRILSMLTLVTFLNSAAWLYLNSTVEPNINRVRQFIDKRISSHDGCYQSTFHLGEYYIRTGDAKNIAEISEQFIRMYPGDKRGYSNYTLYLLQFGKPMDVKINGIFENWLALDSTNIDARTQFSNFHYDVGQRSYRDGSFHEAMDHFRKALILMPDFAEGYNSLGIVYRKTGNDDSAQVYYLKAIALDRSNAHAYINLGNLYDDRGMTDSAVERYRQAIRIQPNMPSAYYNLGITYFKTGALAEGREALIYAARLGMPDAQAFLRERGIPW